MPEPLIVKTVAEMSRWSKDQVKAGKTIGFVPTMGALHAGHRGLIERARRENDAVAVSIFVNPTQFGPHEDFQKYPRTFDADRKLCAEAGADCIFFPDVKEMYDKDARTWVEVGGLGDTLCGLSRPSHFRGVTTVVTKLFNIVRPDRAYFGQKDAQQLRILEVLTRDLCFGIEIVRCETVREPDGLALSSRNQYLSPGERRQALCLSRALEHYRKRVAAGERDAMKLVAEMAEMIEKEPSAEIDYVALVDANTLDDLQTLSGEVLAALAVKIGNTRLIDNVRISLPKP